VQFEFGLALADHGDHAGIVRTRADFGEPDRIAFDEQFHAEQSLAAQVAGDGAGDFPGLAQRYRGHRLRLPALHVIAFRLDMANGFAEMGFHLAVLVQGTYGEQGDFIVEVDEALDDRPPLVDSAAGGGIVPGTGQVFLAVDLALSLAGGGHDRFHHAGVADTALAFHRRAQGLEGIGEGVGRGGQLEFFRGQTTDAFAVHGEMGGARGGNHAAEAGGFQFHQGFGGDGFDLGHHELRFLRVDQSGEDIARGHVDGLRTVRHLVAGGAVVAVHRDDLHAQALQGDDDFLAQFSRAQHHDPCGGWG